ncbi:MAG: serine protease [Proteobacteria bacterium]|nr:serine protease [Pseudomonadota bacterium]
MTADFVQITAPVQAGNSGGPVLDQSGRMVAVVSAGLGKAFKDTFGQRPQNLSCAVAPFVVSAFLQENGVTTSDGRRAKLSPR